MTERQDGPSARKAKARGQRKRGRRPRKAQQEGAAAGSQKSSAGRSRRRRGRKGARRAKASGGPQTAPVPQTELEEEAFEGQVAERLAFLLPDWEPEEDGEDVVAAMEEEWEEEPVEEGPVVNTALAHVQGTFTVEEVDAGDLVLLPGDRIVVSSEKGQISGTVVAPSYRRILVDTRLLKVLRKFDRGDVRQEARNTRKAKNAFLVGRERIKAKGLPMKLVGVDYVHGGNRAIFYFTAEGRVDFRELVRDLARRLRVRIEMRQIGIRDEAGLVGGMGTCGRPLCCATFLRRFDQVSIRMAKDQNLVLNPQKISGQCGRLKCCLVYEHALYKELGQGLPRLGKKVITPKGPGRVTDVDVLGRRVRVALDEGGFEAFDANEVRRPGTPGTQKSNRSDSGG